MRTDCTLLRDDLDLRVLANDLFDLPPLGVERALVMPRARCVRVLGAGEDERIRNGHSGRQRNGSVKRRQCGTKVDAGAERAPVEDENALPVVRLRLLRLIQIDGEDALQPILRVVGLRRLIRGECRSGDEKQSERSRSDLHVYQTIVYARSLHSAATIRMTEVCGIVALRT